MKRPQNLPPRLVRPSAVPPLRLLCSRSQPRASAAATARACSLVTAAVRLRSGVKRPQNLPLRFVRPNAVPPLRLLCSRSQPRASAAATARGCSLVAAAVRLRSGVKRPQNLPLRFVRPNAVPPLRLLCSRSQPRASAAATARGCSLVTAAVRLRSGVKRPQNLPLRFVRPNAVPPLRLLCSRSQPRASAAATARGCSLVTAAVRLRSAVKRPQNLPLRFVRPNAAPPLRLLCSRSQPRASAAATALGCSLVAAAVRLRSGVKRPQNLPPRLVRPNAVPPLRLLCSRSQPRASAAATARGCSLVAAAVRLRSGVKRPQNLPLRFVRPNAVPPLRLLVLLERSAV